MLLSRACEYGIQVMLYLHQHGGERNVPVSEISRKQGIPPSYLAKIVGQLATEGLLVSRRGTGGGVRLARDSTKLKLIDVVKAIDGPELSSRCIIGLPNCGTAAPCPFHDTWGPLREQVIAALSSQSLASLMQGGSFRISRDGRRARGAIDLSVISRSRRVRGVV